MLQRLLPRVPKFKVLRGLGRKLQRRNALGPKHHHESHAKSALGLAGNSVKRENPLKYPSQRNLLDCGKHPHHRALNRNVAAERSNVDSIAGPCDHQAAKISRVPPKPPFPLIEARPTQTRRVKLNRHQPPGSVARKRSMSLACLELSQSIGASCAHAVP